MAHGVFLDVHMKLWTASQFLRILLGHLGIVMSCVELVIFCGCCSLGGAGATGVHGAHLC